MVSDMLIVKNLEVVYDHVRNRIDIHACLHKILQRGRQGKNKVI